MRNTRKNHRLRSSSNKLAFCTVYPPQNLSLSPYIMGTFQEEAARWSARFQSTHIYEYCWKPFIRLSFNLSWALCTIWYLRTSTIAITQIWFFPAALLCLCNECEKEIMVEYYRFMVDVQSMSLPTSVGVIKNEMGASFFFLKFSKVVYSTPM